MAIAIRGGSPATASFSGLTNPSLTLTGTQQPQAGDLLVIVHGNNFYAATNMLTPTVGGSSTGVSAIGTADGGSNLGHIKTWWFAVTSTGDVTVASQENGTHDEEKLLAVYVLSGADTTTPVDGTPVASNGSGSTTAVVSGITVSNPDSYLITHITPNGTANTGATTPPGSMTETYDVDVAATMDGEGAVQQLTSSGATGTRTFTLTNPQPWIALAFAINTAAAGGGSIPWTPPRSAQPRDPGEAWWIQRDRRDANTVGTVANPLVAPLDSAWQADARYWHLYNDLAYRFTFVPYAQRDRRDANTVGTVVSAPPPPVQRAVTARDPGEVPWQQPARRDPALLATALLENELLGSADDLRRHAAWLRPPAPPQQRLVLADQSSQPAVPFDPTLAAWLPMWLAENRAGTHADRREVPQQRPYLSDPSFYPTIPPTDPLTVAWGADGTYWLLYNTAALQVCRRLVPQQRDYKSDPALLATALLENELLGGADDQRRRYLTPGYGDRREVPQQRAAFTLGAPDADPLFLVDGIRRAYLTPGYGDRREVPQQPKRETLYFDAGPDVPPLTLAWGAGGAYWHLYNRPSRPRPFWPLRAGVGVVECSCVTRRPFTGTTARPGTGATTRPFTGVTSPPCVCQ